MTAKNKSKSKEKLPTIWFSFRVKKDKDYLIEQLSVLLSSGMQLVSALESLQLEMNTRYMQAVLERIVEDVRGGSPLWRALEDSEVISEHFIALIKVGEKSGNLVEHLKIVSEQSQKDKIFKSRVTSAILYPAFVMLLAIIIGLGVSVYILPRISSVMGRMGTDLPALTDFLIKMGDFMGKYGIVAVPVFLILLFSVFYLLFGFKKTKHIGDAILLKIPGIKKLLIEVEVSRFGNIAGNLINSGVPILTTLALLQNITTIRLYRKFYEHLLNQVDEGYSLKDSFETFNKIDRIFPLSFRRLIYAAEKSGHLAGSLKKIARVYEDKIEVTSKNLTVMLEPVMLIIVWIGVAALALGIIMPIYSSIGSLGNNSYESQPGPASIESTGDESDAEIEDEEIDSTDEVSLEKVSGTLLISETSTGSLNVRNNPGGSVITQVAPGEEYEYIAEKDGWYKIVLGDGDHGWVSGAYVEVL